MGMSFKKSSSVYTVTYSDMHGVDLSPEGSENCYAYLENMYRDREGGGEGIETVPGFRKLAGLSGKIHAIHPHPTEADTLLLHAGSGLYRYPIAWRDTDTPPEQYAGSELADRESRAAMLGGGLYLADGARYRRLLGGAPEAIDEVAYRPTVYADGEPFEQPNLLSPHAYEEYHLYDLAEHAYHTEEGFTYDLLPDGRCLISGYLGKAPLVVLPIEATVGGQRYPVTGVASSAFLGNATIRILIVPKEITELAPVAFAEMQALTTVVLTGGVAHLPNACFLNCPRLTTLYLGLGVREISASAFRDTALTDVHFAGDAIAFMDVVGHESLRTVGDGSPMHYLSAYRPRHCLFPLCSRVREIEAVTLDGVALPTDGIYMETLTKATPGEGDPTIAIRLSVEDGALLYGKTLRIAVTLELDPADTLSGAHPTYTGDCPSAVNGCRLIAQYDGRLFLSGNPDLPGTVFYTGRRADGEADPTYIGLYQHFTDGGGSGVRALLATATHLLVLTEDSLHGPCIYRHEPQDTEHDLLPRIYPVSDSLSDVGAVGDAILFYDDPLFLSRRGLEAVEAVTMTLSQERRLAHRSARIDPLLQKEDLSRCRFFRFGTYLGIAATGGRVYLADGYERSKGNRSAGYDWYLLNEIGGYGYEKRRYRYVTYQMPEPLVGEMIYPRLGGTPLPIVLSDTAGYADESDYIVSGLVNGYSFAYQKKDGNAVLVDNDGEKLGEDFSPACAFLECGGLLFFGTEGGELFVFNTDKRAPDGSIPRRFYSFNGHAYRSAYATRSEDGGMPHLRKQTLRGEGAVCLQAMAGSRVTVKVATDGGDPRTVDTLYSGRLDFCETDFATAEYGTGRIATLPLREPPSPFVRRAIHLVSEEYMRPFGVISIAYRYRVAGRI